jgi:hypothetical protein
VPEFETVMAGALMRRDYGRRYATAPEVYALAGGIHFLQGFAEDPQASYWPSLIRDKHRASAWAAKRLLEVAISSTTKLRQVADAVDSLYAEQRRDARQANIIHAYGACGNYPPSFPELRKTFVAKFGKRCWPTDFSVRNTLKWLGLPLAKAKRGRPHGSRSIIRNRRQREQ